MSHEVVKTVRGRRYRYRVENYRDPATGKVRGRWTYLGRELANAPDVEPRAPGVEPRAPAGEAAIADLAGRGRRDPARTRARLLEALGRLLERDGYEAVTAGAISAEAGLAHGTFYRHFGEKAEALAACFEEFRASIARARPDFDGPLGDLAAERARVAAWVSGIFSQALERPGILRAFYAHGSANPAVREAKLERRVQLRESVARYFEGLTAAGLASIPRPGELAAALLAIIDGALHVAVLEERPFDPLTIAGARDVFDRAIFTRAEAAAGSQIEG